MIWVIAIVVLLFVLILAGILWVALSKLATEARKEHRMRTEVKVETPVEIRLEPLKTPPPPVFPYPELPPKKYFLGLLCVAKNEAMVIGEFVQHYIEQGVEHMYVIDNGSTDDTKVVLESYIATGFVSYFYVPEPMSQKSSYNTVYKNHARDECDWLMVNDVDEYVFGVSKPFKSILKLELSGCKYLNFQMLNFGSSGHDLQPPNIRREFTLRNAEDAPVNESRIANTKVTFKTASVDYLDIHTHTYKGKAYDVPDSLARLNHYVIMSKEYWQKIKMTRSDAVFGNTTKIRDMTMFNRIDEFANIEDNTLKNIVMNGYTQTQ